MLRKLSSQLNSAVSSISSSPAPQLLPDHHSKGRAETYVKFAQALKEAHIPADESDCATCDHPCPVQEDGTGAGSIAESGQIWDGKSYDEYVMNKYGDLGELPKGHDCDWESELAGSGQPARGRVVVISTGKSNWERDHTDERDSFAYQLNKYLGSLPPNKSGKGPKRTVDFNTRPPLDQFIAPVAPIALPSLPPPTLYSSSLISQADDPEDQTVLVFPDWKVVHEVENSREGAEKLYGDALKGGIGRAGLPGVENDAGGVGRKRSWVLPYRAVVLLCSHKKRDNRCHIAAPLLRAALITCLAKYKVNIDETGSSLCGLQGPPLEEVQGDHTAREAEVNKRIEGIEAVHGGEGGEVGIFNINHLGGHRYSGVMLKILFPSGAFLSYGRVSPQEIPRVVEETILQGKIVPGLLRAAAGVNRSATPSQSLLNW